MKKKNVINIILALIVIISLFIFVSHIAKKYSSSIKENLEDSFFEGIIFYIFLTIIDVVGLPISTIPLVPLVSSLYGWQLAAFLSVIGWTFGCIIAFFISRKYGVPFVQKFASKEQIDEVSKFLPEKNMFWFIIFARMFMPLDLGSYSLGILTKINYKLYTLSSFIGIAISASFFAYLGALPIIYEIIGMVLAVSMIFLWLHYVTRKKKNVTIS